MKKRQAAIIVALIAALLALSGCADAILEVFYPEFAPDSGGESVISIWVEFNMYEDQLSGTGQYVAGQLIDTTTSEVVFQAGMDPFWHYIGDKYNPYWHIEGNLDFYGVKDGEYWVLVWLEQGGNNQPFGPGEPYKYAINVDSGNDTFVVPGKSSDGWIFGDAISPLY